MNIYDIAEKSGVSIATVSRVLNNSPSVKAQTREKVLQVMEQEGFTPNSLARSLSTGSTRTVGILCTDIRDSFYAGALGIIEEELRQRKMQTVLRCTGTETEDKRRALDEMAGRNVDGIILIGSVFREEADNSHIAVAAGKTPIIIINGYVDLPNVYCVTCNEREAIRDLVALMFQRHRQKILFLHDAMTYSCRQKIAGYRDAYTEAGLTPDEAWLVPVERNLDAINACIKHLLVKGISFDAVIGSEDILALGAQKSLMRIGLKIPVVGVNNSVLARCCTPELTSVDNRLEAMCRKALEMLDGLTAGTPVETHAELSAHLVERESFRYT